MDQSNGHNNQCSNQVFKVYAYCHHCSSVHKVPNRLGSTMMCLSNSALTITTHHNLAHPHPRAVNNESTIFQGDNDMHDNDDSPTSNNVDNDSNCLCDTSNSNESSSFLKGTSTHEDSKVYFFCNSNFENTYNSSILFYICTRSMGAPVESQQHLRLTMADSPHSVALPPSPPTAVCFTNTCFKDVPINKKSTEIGQEMTEFMSDADSFDQDSLTLRFDSNPSPTLLFAEDLHDTGIKDASLPQKNKEWNKIDCFLEGR
jgi:hypothetical protein